MLRSIVKRLVPRPLVSAYHRAALYRRRSLDAERPIEEVFDEIHRRGRWGASPDGWYSGSGSSPDHASAYIGAIADFVRERGIRSLVDVGCGDFRIGAELARMVVDYTGVDIVPGLIERNNRLFASDRVRFVCLDVTCTSPPNADLAVVRQVFQHLSNSQIAAALRHLDNLPYVLITEHHPALERMVGPNLDKPHGGCTRVTDGSAVCPEKHPFNVQAALFHEMPVRRPLIGPGETLRTYLIENAADRTPPV